MRTPNCQKKWGLSPFAFRKGTVPIFLSLFTIFLFTSTPLFASDAQIIGRHIFYNNSAFDKVSDSLTDNDAIAPDKEALLPGNTATFANYTSYPGGINGIIIDIRNPADPTNITSNDFTFKIGNNNDIADWANAPPPESVTVTQLDATTHRIKLIWPDNAIMKQWLEIKVLATNSTGLRKEDTFYFGNAVGESGNSATDAKVNAFDMLGARDNPRHFLNPAPIDFNYDYSRDKRVNTTDMLIARDNQTHFRNALRLIDLSNVPFIFNTDTTIEDDNFEYDNRNIIVDGCTVTINGVHTFKDFLVVNSGVITHSPCTETTTSSLYITVDNLTIDATSTIDVTGRGYVRGRTLGNATEGASTNGAGGSYGGLGGLYDRPPNPNYRNNIYGDLTDPNELGSGGGGAGSGGGLINIQALSIFLDGSIIANADSFDMKNGSGGCINISSQSLSGVGSITANGADPAHDTFGGGGGGRIAIFYDDISEFNIDNIQSGGKRGYYGGRNGGAGTIYLKSSNQEYGDLIIDNNDLETPSPYYPYSTPLRSVGQGTITAISTNTLTDVSANFPVPNPETGALGLKGLRLNPNTSQSQLFTIIDNTSRTITVDGDISQVADVGDAYIGVYVFDNLFIRGAAKVGTEDNIDVLGTIEIDGFLECNGLNYLGANSLNLTNSELRLNGSLSLSVDLILDQSTLRIDGNLTLLGDLTLTQSSLIIDEVLNFSRDLDLFQSNLSIGGPLNLSRDLFLPQSTLVVDRALIAPNITLQDSSKITHHPGTYTTTSYLYITVDNLTIDSTSSIDVYGKGYMTYRTLGNTTEGASTDGAGGSYGGLGGLESTPFNPNDRNDIYGDLTNPNELGSGGGLSWSGSDGGGHVKIQAGSVLLDGSINADGETDWGNGSGGCINITTQALSGDGIITANGGGHVSGSGNFGYGGGGGGRIAIFYDDISGFDKDNIQCRGARGYRDYPNTKNGGAGTIYLKSSSQEYGDLIIDNNNLETDTYSTPLRSVGQGTITAISTNTLTDENADFPVPDPVTGALGLKGLKLNPNINQSQLFTIIDNTETTITVDGDISQVADVGDTYIGVYVFDNVKVVNGARVWCDDYIYIIGALDTTGGELAIDPEMPTAQISSPQEGQTISGVINILGTATDNHFNFFRLDYGESAIPTSWAEITNSQTPVENSVLGTLDTTLISNGHYTIRLQTRDVINNVSTANIFVTVYNEGPEIENLEVIPNPFSPDESGTYVDLTTGEVFQDPGPNRVLDDIAVIHFDIATHAYMKIDVYDSSGTHVRSVVNGAVYPGASNHVEIGWDGKDNNGEFIRNGNYTILLNAGSPARERSIVVTANAMPRILDISVEPNPFSPDGDGIDETADISYFISEDSYVTIKIYNLANDLMRTLLDNQLRNRGSYVDRWSGLDNMNNSLPSGTYRIVIEAIATTENIATPVTMHVSMQTISNIDVTNKEFDPHIGQNCQITYYLSSDGIITIEIYNEEDTLIRNLITAIPRSRGRHTENWDGRNNSGQIVPDGLYYFIIKDSITGTPIIVFDPRGTGGEDISHSVAFDVTNFDPLNNIPSQLTYTLPRPAKVTIKVRRDRYGGPALKVIKYLEPTTTETHQAIWDGRDELGNLLPPHRYTMAIWAYTLMDGAIIVMGGRPTVSGVSVEPIRFNPTENPYGTTSKSTTISYNLSKDANVAINIFGSNNSLVRTLNEGLKTAGVNTAIWDGKNNNAQLAPPDRYRIEIQTDIDGNFSDTLIAHTEIHY